GVRRGRRAGRRARGACVAPCPGGGRGRGGPSAGGGPCRHCSRERERRGPAEPVHRKDGFHRGTPSFTRFCTNRMGLIGCTNNGARSIVCPVPFILAVMADLAPGSTHGRIRSELERRITGGAWPVGTRLPPEPVLARQLGVSRGTLRRALGTLREHGLIEAAPRRGSFVISAVRTTVQSRQIGVVVPSIAKPSAASLV